MAKPDAVTSCLTIEFALCEWLHTPIDSKKPAPFPPTLREQLLPYCEVESADPAYIQWAVAIDNLAECYQQYIADLKTPSSGSVFALIGAPDPLLSDTPTPLLGLKQAYVRYQMACLTLPEETRLELADRIHVRVYETTLDSLRDHLLDQSLFSPLEPDVESIRNQLKDIRHEWEEKGWDLQHRKDVLPAIAHQIRALHNIAKHTAPITHLERAADRLAAPITAPWTLAAYLAENQDTPLNPAFLETLITHIRNTRRDLGPWLWHQGLESIIPGIRAWPLHAQDSPLDRLPDKQHTLINFLIDLHNFLLALEKTMQVYAHTVHEHDKIRVPGAREPKLPAAKGDEKAAPYITLKTLLPALLQLSTATSPYKIIPKILHGLWNAGQTGQESFFTKMMLFGKTCQKSISHIPELKALSDRGVALAASYNTCMDQISDLSTYVAAESARAIGVITRISDAKNVSVRENTAKELTAWIPASATDEEKTHIETAISEISHDISETFEQINEIAKNISYEGNPWELFLKILPSVHATLQAINRLAGYVALKGEKEKLFKKFISEKSHYQFLTALGNIEEKLHTMGITPTVHMAFPEDAKPESVIGKTPDTPQGISTRLGFRLLSKKYHPEPRFLALPFGQEAKMEEKKAEEYGADQSPVIPVIDTVENNLRGFWSTFLDKEYADSLPNPKDQVTPPNRDGSASPTLLVGIYETTHDILGHVKAMLNGLHQATAVQKAPDDSLPYTIWENLGKFQKSVTKLQDQFGDFQTLEKAMFPKGSVLPHLSQMSGLLFAWIKEACPLEVGKHLIPDALWKSHSTESQRAVYEGLVDLHQGTGPILSQLLNERLAEWITWVESSRNITEAQQWKRILTTDILRDPAKTQAWIQELQKMKNYSHTIHVLIEHLKPIIVDIHTIADLYPKLLGINPDLLQKLLTPLLDLYHSLSPVIQNSVEGPFKTERKARLVQIQAELEKNPTPRPLTEYKAILLVTKRIQELDTAEKTEQSLKNQITQLQKDLDGLYAAQEPSNTDHMASLWQKYSEQWHAVHALWEPIPEAEDPAQSGIVSGFHLFLDKAKALIAETTRHLKGQDRDADVVNFQNRCFETITLIQSFMANSVQDDGASKTYKDWLLLFGIMTHAAHAIAHADTLRENMIHLFRKDVDTGCAEGIAFLQKNVFPFWNTLRYAEKNQTFSSVVRKAIVDMRQSLWEQITCWMVEYIGMPLAEERIAQITAAFQEYEWRAFQPFTIPTTGADVARATALVVPPPVAAAPTPAVAEPPESTSFSEQYHTWYAKWRPLCREGSALAALLEHMKKRIDALEKPVRDEKGKPVTDGPQYWMEKIAWLKDFPEDQHIVGNLLQAFMWVGSELPANMQPAIDLFSTAKHDLQAPLLGIYQSLLQAAAIQKQSGNGLGSLDTFTRLNTRDESMTLFKLLASFAEGRSLWNLELPRLFGVAYQLIRYQKQLTHALDPTIHSIVPHIRHMLVILEVYGTQLGLEWEQLMPPEQVSALFAQAACRLEKSGIPYVPGWEHDRVYYQDIMTGRQKENQELDELRAQLIQLLDPANNPLSTGTLTIGELNTLRNRLLLIGSYEIANLIHDIIETVRANTTAAKDHAQEKAKNLQDTQFHSQKRLFQQAYATLFDQPDTTRAVIITRMALAPEPTGIYPSPVPKEKLLYIHHILQFLTQTGYDILPTSEQKAINQILSEKAQVYFKEHIDALDNILKDIQEKQKQDEEEKSEGKGFLINKDGIVEINQELFAIIQDNYSTLAALHGGPIRINQWIRKEAYSLEDLKAWIENTKKSIEKSAESPGSKRFLELFMRLHPTRQQAFIDESMQAIPKAIRDAWDQLYQGMLKTTADQSPYQKLAASIEKEKTQYVQDEAISSKIVSASDPKIGSKATELYQLIAEKHDAIAHAIVQKQQYNDEIITHCQDSQGKITALLTQEEKFANQVAQTLQDLLADPKLGIPIAFQKIVATHIQRAQADQTYPVSRFINIVRKYVDHIQIGNSTTKPHFPFNTACAILLRLLPDPLRDTYDDYWTRHVARGTEKRFALELSNRGFLPRRAIHASKESFLVQAQYFLWKYMVIRILPMHYLRSVTIPSDTTKKDWYTGIYHRLLGWWNAITIPLEQYCIESVICSLWTQYSHHPDQLPEAMLYAASPDENPSEPETSSRPAPRINAHLYPATRLHAEAGRAVETTDAETAEVANPNTTRRGPQR